MKCLIPLFVALGAYTVKSLSISVDQKAGRKRANCECVNHGGADGVDGNFDAPAPDQPTQRWISANGEDTVYAQQRRRINAEGYEAQAFVDYGEFCYPWEDIFATGGIANKPRGGAGSNTNCTEAFVSTTEDNRPNWCRQRWCYVKVAGTNEAHGEGTVTKPVCDNIPEDEITLSTYKNLQIYFSYGICNLTNANP